MSQLKIKNGNNWIDIPASGVGVPSGGTTGQILQKSSNTDYATEWADKPRFRTAKKQYTVGRNISSVSISADAITGYEFACWLFVVVWYVSGSTYNTYWTEAEIADTTASSTTVTVSVWTGADRQMTAFALYQKV